MSSTNPFDESTRASSASARQHRIMSGRPRRAAPPGEPPIWAARHVEWPIPNTLSLQNYNRLLKASKQAGQQLGITKNTPFSTGKANASSQNETAQAATTTEDGRSSEGGYGLSGFMSRVLNTSAASEKSDDEMVDAGSMSSRPIRPPRPGCVTAANGWIVAALECASQPILRLVSRWNVRRGGMADQWVALPPPVEGNSRIAHVFVDPTASHTFLSAINGEAYYLHCSQRQVSKLAGFGRNADGSLLTKDALTGVSSSSVAGRRDETLHSKIQKGLTTGSYVTAVAWDNERGTEGSSKRILLGTSNGEIYEYSLVSSNSEDQEEILSHPLLLHKLYASDSADPTEVGAAVTGLHFERLRTGMLVMAATSGRSKRTRFYTFYSAHNSSFAMVVADQQHSSLMELPGSADFADLRICNDHFGLRTATGIFYGTIDRSLSSSAVLTGSSSGMIIESGILPYDGGSKSISDMPVSLALTPHHLITLNELNEIRFLSRVAQKMIQKEHVDVGAQGNVDETLIGVGELLMDVRRPDQVWLRKGRSLVHISSTQEDRDVWKFTLKKCLDLQLKNKTLPSTPSQIAGAKEARTQPNVPTVLTAEEKAQEALFEQAKTLCTNNAQKAVVTAVRAEYHLSHGRAELAAKYMAQCPPVLKPFADSSIRLALPRLGIDDSSVDLSPEAFECLATSNIPLITYLNDKMRAGRVKDDKMTCTMIGAWLTELILHEREVMMDCNNGPMPTGGTVMLAQFLDANIENMDAKTVLKILASHDIGAGECATFAAKSGDLNTAVNASLSIGSQSTGASSALKILNDASFDLAEPLYYKNALTFLTRIPVEAVESFLAKYSKGLSPLKLLPSMMNYERTRCERLRVRRAMEERANSSSGKEESKEALDIHVDGSTVSSGGFELKIESNLPRASSSVDDSSILIKYFEGVIQQGCRSSAIFSYLLSLYIKLDDEEPLLQFLTKHVPFQASSATKQAMLREDSLSISTDEMGPLDMSYALRTVLSSGRHFRSAVKLYMGFGMRYQAVELCLKVDPELARELAQESVELEERKRLWLMIAKNAASDGSLHGRDVVARVVSVLKDCGPDVLSIEDVLPFLPDFTRIDEIKDEICEALTSYSTKIDRLLNEMGECDRTCDLYRAEIQRLQNHHMKLSSDARCAVTNKPVLGSGEPFYVFPSGYVFLSSSLRSLIMPHLNDKQRSRIAELDDKLGRLNDKEKARSEFQGELDGLIAAECPLTGMAMVESIDKDFDDSDEIQITRHVRSGIVDRADL